MREAARGERGNHISTHKVPHTTPKLWAPQHKSLYPGFLDPSIGMSEMLVITGDHHRCTIGPICSYKSLQNCFQVCRCLGGEEGSLDGATGLLTSSEPDLVSRKSLTCMKPST